jgi:hypothetical protein
MRRCGLNGLNGSDGQHWRGSLSDRILIAENGCAAFFVSTVSGTDAGVVQRLKGVTVCTIGSEHWQGSLSDRILKPLHLHQCWRWIAEIALVTAAAYAPGVVLTVSPDCRVGPRTLPPTWTGPPLFFLQDRSLRMGQPSHVLAETSVSAQMRLTH